MSLRTLERDAPSLFKNRLPAPAQLAAFCVLALTLMLVDARLHLIAPLRQALVTVLYPAQQALLQPLRWISDSASYLETLEAAQSAAHRAEQEIAAMSVRARLADKLAEENQQLRDMLALRERLTLPIQAAEVVYESPDAYARRVIIDKGQVAGIVPGSPVLDAQGIVGQVVRVQPFTSEVRLLIDRDQAIPVQVARTGVRGVAYGLASNVQPDAIELRYMPSDADVLAGDVLLTSGIDGVYPPDLPVATVTTVERQGGTTFLHINGQPLARMQGLRYVMVQPPVQEALQAQLPAAQELQELIAPSASATRQAREDKSAQRRATPQLPKESAP